MHSLLALAFLLTLVSGLNAAELFRSAAGQVDITPPPERGLWGYSDRPGNAKGVLDPLFARILLLESGTNRLALVTLDLGRTFGPPVLDAVRDRVRKSAAVNQVFFMASHTHAGPVIDDQYPPGETPAWETESMEKISNAIETASRRLVPSRIGVGYGETYIGHNRRQILRDGSVKMLWRNATKTPTSPVDPSVGVIRIDSEKGAPLAILVNYSCHPVVLGPDNFKYSADYPGAMARLVKTAFESGPVTFFIQGGAGDINPYFDKTPLAEAGEKVMNQTGEQLGKEVVRIANEIRTQTPQKPSLKFALDNISFQLRWNAEKTLAGIESRTDARTAGYYRRSFRSPIICPVMSVLINEEIAIIGMPGEPFVDFAIDMRARSPVRHAIFAGYANGYYAYFPTIAAAAQGGYGANSVTTRVEVGAGECMLNHGLIRLLEMLGQLRETPQQEK